MTNVFLVIQGLARAPYIDVNMARVMERLFGRRRLSDLRYDQELQGVARRLVRSPNCQRLNWAILDLAALVCTPRNPSCAACPLSSTCDYAILEAKALPRKQRNSKDRVTYKGARLTGLSWQQARNQLRGAR
jgi:A/G-specific adenine glycosylase